MARHRSEAERAQWVSRWRASGASCERFARKHGLSSGTLYRWSRGAGQDVGTAVPGFAEVRVVGEVSSAALELEHRSGCVVRVRGDVDEAQLRAVLRALGTC
jgi:transposase-like protein